MVQRKQVNTPYPKYWRLRQRGQSFYITFRVPDAARALWGNKKEVLLGKGKTRFEAEKAAYELWARKIQSNVTPYTMGNLFDKYLADVVPGKAKKTQDSNINSIKRLRATCADIPVTAYETYMAFQYKEACGKGISEKIANLDLEVLSHCFSKAFEWGVPIKEHPMKGKVTKFSRLPRTRYVEDWELAEFLKFANPMLQVYIPLKIATGKDQSIILDIKLADIKEDGLHFPKRKKIKASANAKASVMPFFDKDGNSTGLKELIDDVMSWRAKHLKIGSLHLFATSHGKPYFDGGNNSAFKSMWQRAMRKALSETELKEKFTEHDLCSKTASDAETLEEAARLRGHTNTKTTQQVYRVKPEVVLPLRKK